ncbi:hypothetical protein [Bacillus subtilis]|uniref:hypothetical protein n=1 Tax=Bacillus subtilis TaxID=1423 RepID=UPI003F82BF3F
MSKLTITPTSLTGKSNKNKGRFALAVLAGISASGGFVINDAAQHKILETNSSYIKRYSFAYDNAKSNSQLASPKKEDQFILKRKQFVFNENENVTRIVSNEERAEKLHSFTKPLAFSADNEEFNEIGIGDITEIEHSYIEDSVTEEKTFSFKKPMVFSQDNSEFDEVIHYEAIEDVHDEDGWI